MTALNRYADLAGRILIAHIFVLSGIGKIAHYAGTQAYMHSAGVPGMLLPLVILTELGGGILIIIGWQTRWAALALAGFCLLAALLFHAHFGQGVQKAMFMKDFAIAGGFLFLFANGPGELSLDRRKRGG